MGYSEFRSELLEQLDVLPKWRMTELVKDVCSAMKRRYGKKNRQRVEAVDFGFSDEELYCLMAVVKRKIDADCFRVMFTLGLRVGELLRLRGRDLKDGQLLIHSEKGSYDAVVRVPAHILDCFSSCAPHERLFPIEQKTLRFHFAEYRKAAGLEQVYMLSRPRGSGMSSGRCFRLKIHSFRHYAIRKFYELTKDPDLTRAFARHRSIDSTQQYMAPSKKEAVDAVLNQMVVRDLRSVSFA